MKKLTSLFVIARRREPTKQSSSYFFAGLLRLRLAMTSFVFFLAFFIASVSFAAPNFPALTGRVVDDAHILTPAYVQNLEQILAQHERETSNQLVVATIPNLQELDIAEYGYQLGRAWGIGQKGKNNGVLLIVAPNEKKVRIEVGYGLEGTLTDAISSQIIQNVILPKFKEKDYSLGISDGVSMITQAVKGNDISGAIAPQPPSAHHHNSSNDSNTGSWLFLAVAVVIIAWFAWDVCCSILFLLLNILSMLGIPLINTTFGKFLKRYSFRFLGGESNIGVVIWEVLRTIAIMSFLRGGSGSNSDDDNFSGGGGSFGGGGSSGKW